MASTNNVLVSVLFYLTGQGDIINLSLNSFLYRLCCNRDFQTNHFKTLHRNHCAMALYL